MAKKKVVKKPTRPKQKPVILKAPPADYLRGSKRVGDKYTAWNTYGQGKPDFGKGDKSGPGTPYHEVIKKVTKPVPDVVGHGARRLEWGKKNTAENAVGVGNDAKTAAIRRRLRGQRYGGL